VKSKKHANLLLPKGIVIVGNLFPRGEAAKKAGRASSGKEHNRLRNAIQWERLAQREGGKQKACEPNRE